MGRVTLLVVASLVVGALAAAAARPATPPPRVQISFTGSATGAFRDVERWIFLENNECYLRRTRDQHLQLTWSGTLAGAVGRLPRAVSSTGTGTVTGTEVRDTCDEDELPPDAPEDWLRSLTCSDAFAHSAPVLAAWRGSGARPVLELSGPELSLAKEAVCSALPRRAELAARIPVARKTLERLARGKSLTFRVGTAVPRYGEYTPNANCKHEAKPYEGYRSLDECQDRLVWSGTVRILRIR